MATTTNTTGDSIFRGVLFIAATVILLIVGAMLTMMIVNSLPTLQQYGAAFFTGTIWDQARNQFGALPFIYGTVVSSLIAVLIAVPISIGIAIFLTEQAPKSLARPIAFMVELLAAIPSVVFGLWGIFVLAPLIGGKVMLTAGIILAIMITPIITAVVRDILEVVPTSQREAALALGATQWETTQIVLSNAVSGIAGAVVLGLGRALGETMAVTMVIGNIAQINLSPLEPANTIASVIALNFADAFNGSLYKSALIQMGLVLFMVTFTVNALAKLLVSNFGKMSK
ncbi:MAG: phosphate ABC transporter permease subunit PstC [Pyrinomonadaceae bacterium]|nr:phosphate ABC transporter permease subunit PstC [Pyrinomonadaceae bacterium]